MIEILFIFLTLLALYILLSLWVALFPIAKAGKPSKVDVLDPPNVYLYSFVIHIHTQFSYDSLGKPQDVIKARDKEEIDFAVVTDHNNDYIRFFTDPRMLAGKEVKITDPKGKILGDLLEIGDIKVVAHPFREKYRWRLPKREDYFVEVVDLRDALLDQKGKLILFLLWALLSYPLLGSKVISPFKALVDIHRYSKTFLEEGWRNKLLGGLDHHVKFYVNEVRKRILIPDYSLSFSLLRNFLVTDREVKKAEDFLKALKRGYTLVSFSSKPALVWKEGSSIKAYSPFRKTLFKVLRRIPTGGVEVQTFHGSNLAMDHLAPGTYLVLGYTYKLKVMGFVLGLRPLFVASPLEV